MKIITVAALKGGVGKTNFVFNLATTLAYKNHKVLVIDLDPQSNLSRSFKKLKKDSSAKQLFSQNIQIDEAKLIEHWVYEDLKIDIIPTSIAMQTLENELINRTAVDTILQRTFAKNIKVLEQYEYIIIDTSPSLNVLNKNALLISSEIILISDNSIYSLDAINMISSNWASICKDLGISNNINTIVLNNFDHYRVSKDVTEYLTQSEFRDKILENQIRRKQSLKKSEITGIPSILLEKDNHIYHEIYKELKAKEIL